LRQDLLLLQEWQPTWALCADVVRNPSLLTTSWLPGFELQTQILAEFSLADCPVLAQLIAMTRYRLCGRTMMHAQIKGARRRLYLLPATPAR